ncbi:MAG: hypothetical protein ACI9H6_000762 [Patiriisocius sp.]|jgi:hypothetical protein
MYSHTNRVPWFKAMIVSIMIFAMIFVAVPQQSDAVILLFVAAASTAALTVAAVVTLVVIDAIVLCAVGVICSSGSTGSTPPVSTCNANQGNSCTSAANSCGSRNTGTYRCNGTCSASTPSAPAPTSCTSSANVCGARNTGVRTCGTCSASTPSAPITSCASSANFCGQTNQSARRQCGVCSGGSPPSDYIGSCSSPANYCGMVNSSARIRCDNVCIGSTPANTLCTGLPLDADDALVISPSIVREGDDITISWDLGMNYPPVCTLTGSHISPTFSFGAGDRTGSMTITVTGPHQYTLSCGSSEVIKTVRILPALFET